jgi:SAP domain-containing new25
VRLVIDAAGGDAKLSKTMTVEAFDRGYWYAAELRRFADSLGIPSAKKLRKDELEEAVKTFLRTGKLAVPTKRALSRTGTRDVDRGLRLDLPVVHYTSNRETKAFLEREALRMSPGLKRRSGVRYRLNRWREAQLVQGKKLTYGDLVREYVRLTTAAKPFARIPHGRYINFVADFLAAEKNATREAAIHAWEGLKALDIPKDYASWVKHRAARRR